MDITVAEYFQIVSGKTAALFEWSGEAGARAAQAPVELLPALRIFTREIGCAFQLVDDVLDLSKSAAALGKAVMQDLRVGTMTYPLIQTVRVRPELGRWLETLATGGEETALGQAVLSVVREAGGVEATYREIARRTEQAERSLSSLPASPAQEILAELARNLGSRTR
jgi:geranylgeranyl pyrophosphate synthase